MLGLNRPTPCARRGFRKTRCWRTSHRCCARARGARSARCLPSCVLARCRPQEAARSACGKQACLSTRRSSAGKTRVATHTHTHVSVTCGTPLSRMSPGLLLCFRGQLQRSAARTHTAGHEVARRSAPCVVLCTGGGEWIDAHAHTQTYIETAQTRSSARPLPPVPTPLHNPSPSRSCCALVAAGRPPQTPCMRSIGQTRRAGARRGRAGRRHTQEGDAARWRRYFEDTGLKEVPTYTAIGPRPCSGELGMCVCVCGRVCEGERNCEFFEAQPSHMRTRTHTAALSTHTDTLMHSHTRSVFLFQRAAPAERSRLRTPSDEARGSY